MSFWDNIKLSGLNGSPLVPKISQNNEEDRQQKNRNIFSNLLTQVPEDSFVSHKRLNDTDSNILNKNLVQFLPTDSLRIELQLESAEKDLKDTDKQINAVKLLELDKSGDKLAALQEKKELINKEIQDYRSEYRDLGLIYKLTDIYTEGYDRVKNKFQEIKNNFTGHPVSIKIKEILSPIKQKSEVEEIIEKFDALQESTKNVFDVKNSPLGEQDAYFKDFTAVMAQANKLDSQANKILNPPEEPKSTIIENIRNFPARCVNFAGNSYSKFTEFTRSLKDSIDKTFNI